MTAVPYVLVEVAASAPGTPEPAAPPHYAGLVTRALAFALDSVVVNGVALLVSVTVGLGVALLHLPEEIDVVIASVMGAAWLLWTVAYFVFFWSSTGQTPGDRVMHVAVVDGRGRGPLKPRRALVRFIGLILAALPLLAGFLMMLWDGRRRCLQDRVARTVVVHSEPPLTPPAQRHAEGVMSGGPLRDVNHEVTVRGTSEPL